MSAEGKKKLRDRYLQTFATYKVWLRTTDQLHHLQAMEQMERGSVVEALKSFTLALADPASQQDPVDQNIVRIQLCYCLLRVGQFHRCWQHLSKVVLRGGGGQAAGSCWEVPDWGRELFGFVGGFKQYGEDKEYSFVMGSFDTLSQYSCYFHENKCAGYLGGSTQVWGLLLVVIKSENYLSTVKEGKDLGPKFPMSRDSLPVRPSNVPKHKLKQLQMSHTQRVRSFSAGRTSGFTDENRIHRPFTPGDRMYLTRLLSNDISKAEWGSDRAPSPGNQMDVFVRFIHPFIVDWCGGGGPGAGGEYDRTLLSCCSLCSMLLHQEFCWSLGRGEEISTADIHRWLSSHKFAVYVDPNEPNGDPFSPQTLDKHFGEVWHIARGIEAMAECWSKNDLILKDPEKALTIEGFEGMTKLDIFDSAELFQATEITEMFREQRRCFILKTMGILELQRWINEGNTMSEEEKRKVLESALHQFTDALTASGLEPIPPRQIPSVNDYADQPAPKRACIRFFDNMLTSWLYSNRSAVYYAMGEWRKALDDAKSGFCLRMHAPSALIAVRGGRAAIKLKAFKEGLGLVGAVRQALRVSTTELSQEEAAVLGTLDGLFQELQTGRQLHEATSKSSNNLAIGEEEEEENVIAHFLELLNDPAKEDEEPTPSSEDLLQERQKIKPESAITGRQKGSGEKCELSDVFDESIPLAGFTKELEPDDDGFVPSTRQGQEQLMAKGSKGSSVGAKKAAGKKPTVSSPTSAVQHQLTIQLHSNTLLQYSSSIWLDGSPWVEEEREEDADPPATRTSEVSRRHHSLQTDSVARTDQLIDELAFLELMIVGGGVTNEHSSSVDVQTALKTMVAERTAVEKLTSQVQGAVQSAEKKLQSARDTSKKEMSKMNSVKAAEIQRLVKELNDEQRRETKFKADRASHEQRRLQEADKEQVECESLREAISAVDKKISKAQEDFRAWEKKFNTPRDPTPTTSRPPSPPVEEEYKSNRQKKREREAEERLKRIEKRAAQHSEELVQETGAQQKNARPDLLEAFSSAGQSRQQQPATQEAPKSKRQLKRELKEAKAQKEAERTAAAFPPPSEGSSISEESLHESLLENYLRPALASLRKQGVKSITKSDLVTKVRLDLRDKDERSAVFDLALAKGLMEYVEKTEDGQKIYELKSAIELSRKQKKEINTAARAAQEREEQQARLTAVVESTPVEKSKKQLRQSGGQKERTLHLMTSVLSPALDRLRHSGVTSITKSDLVTKVRFELPDREQRSAVFSQAIAGGLMDFVGKTEDGQMIYQLVVTSTSKAKGDCSGAAPERATSDHDDAGPGETKKSNRQVKRELKAEKEARREAEKSAQSEMGSESQETAGLFSSVLQPHLRLLRKRGVHSITLSDLVSKICQEIPDKALRNSVVKVAISKGLLEFVERTNDGQKIYRLVAGAVEGSGSDVAKKRVDKKTATSHSAEEELSPGPTSAATTTTTTTTNGENPESAKSTTGFWKEKRRKWAENDKRKAEASAENK